MCVFFLGAQEEESNSGASTTESIHRQMSVQPVRLEQRFMQAQQLHDLEEENKRYVRQANAESAKLTKHEANFGIFSNGCLQTDHIDALRRACGLTKVRLLSYKADSVKGGLNMNIL